MTRPFSSAGKGEKGRGKERRGGGKREGEEEKGLGHLTAICDIIGQALSQPFTH